jgi:uncharacterized protein YjdB
VEENTRLRRAIAEPKPLKERQETQMFNRFCFAALLLAGIMFPLTSCGGGPSLTSIVVSPALMNFGGTGLTTQLTAIGYYTHPNHPAGTKNITNQVSWTSSTPQCVTVSSTGLITSGGNICSNILVTASAPGFNGIIQGSMTVNVTQTAQPNSDIVAVAVIPAAQTVASLNVPIQYEAVGTDGSGGTHALGNFAGLSWVSSDSSVATINAASGLATTAGSGTTSITAIFKNADGIAAEGSATLTVAPTGSPEPLTAMTVAPNAQTALAIGQTAQFLAIATTGSGTSVNLTGQTATVAGQTIKAATWTSSNPSVASINSATGVATALSAGATVITAIATNPNDGSVVTGTATYTVTVSTSISAEPLTGLSIIPSAQTALAVNQKVNFIAIGATGSGGSVNLTNQSATINGVTVKAAVWSSSNPSVATVDPATGIATALSAGVTAITAIATNTNDGTVVTATALFTVTVPKITEPYVSLVIVPASQTATAAGQLAQYLAIGTTGTGTTVDLTSQAIWSSSSLAVAKPTATAGQFTAVANGVAAVTAVVANPGVGGNPPDGSSVTASATYNVAIVGTPEPLVSLAIYPSSQSVASPNQTGQFTAIGTFSSAPTTQNLTSNNTTYPIRWTSSDSSVATVGSPEKAGTTPGLVTAVGQGTAAILAVASNSDGSVVTAVATFTVTGGTTEPITALTIYPGSLSLGATGQTGQFIAIGTSGLTGLNEDVTNSTSLQWTATIPTIATVCTTAPVPSPAPCTSTTNGLVTGKSPGATNITASWTNPDNSVVTAQASVTVTVTPQPEPLLRITIVPASIIVGNTYLTGQFLAFGTFSTDPTMMDITNGFTHAGFTGEVPVTWASSSPDVFPVTETGGPGSPGGVVTALGTGSSAITVEAANTDGTVVNGAATFGCVPPTGTYCQPGQTPVSTLTVMNAGQNQTNWLVTATDITGTVTVIHCGGSVEQAAPGGSVCYSNYPEGTTVTLTVPAGAGQFGGWSANCTPTTPITVGGPNSCTVTLTTTDIVAAIIN